MLINESSEEHVKAKVEKRKNNTQGGQGKEIFQLNKPT